jgi:hypothetical protein
MKIETYKILFALTLLVTFSACNNSDNVQPKKAKITEDDLQKIQSFQQEVGFIQSFLTENLFSFDNSGGRLSIRKNITQQFEEYFPCAEPADSDSDTVHVALDFGEGCQREDGVILFGKIELTTILAGDSLTFSTKYVDYYEVSGEDESPVVNGECNGTLSFSPSVFFLLKYFYEDFHLTYKDGTTASFSLSQRIESIDNGAKFVELASDASTPDGDTFHTELVTPLIISFACEDDIEYPVKGIESITFNEKVAKINYGDGACDNEYEIINE